MSLDLNKPLPPSPQPSTSSSNTSDSYPTSPWMGMLELVEADQDPGRTTSNQYAALSRKILQAQGDSVQQTANVGSSRGSELDVVHPKRSLTAQTAETDLHSPVEDSNRLPLNSHTQSSQQLQEFSADNDFKSFSYDSVHQRPIKFYPQGRLMDLPSRKKGNKMSITRIFRRSKSRRPVKATPSDEWVDPRAVASPVKPPRPPRPPRPPQHLCPSPPYNPANMPTWKVSDTPSDSERLSGRRSEWSTSPGLTSSTYPVPSSVHSSQQVYLQPQERSVSFVSLTDLYFCGKKKPQRTPPAKVAKNSVINSLDRADTPTPETYRHSASSYLQLIESEHTIAGETDERTTGHKRQPYKYQVANLHRNKHHNHTVGELAHVPEDMSVHSFSNKVVCQDMDAGRKCSYQVRPGSRFSVASDSGRYSPSVYSHRDSLWRDDARAQADARNDDYTHERERIKSVSTKLREQYQTEWDDMYKDRLRSAETIIASYSIPAQLRVGDISPFETEPTVSRSRSHDDLKPLTPYTNSIASSDLPTLSSTMARLAELCERHEIDTLPSAISRIYTDTDTDESPSRHSDSSGLVPAPLRSIDPYHCPSPYRSALSQSDMRDLQAQRQHEFSSSRSTQPQSFNFQDRTFTDSTLGRLSVVSSLSSEPGEQISEIDCRSVSPLLPTPPTLRRSPLPRFVHRNSKPLPPTPSSMISPTKLRSGSPADEAISVEYESVHSIRDKIEHTSFVDQQDDHIDQDVHNIHSNSPTYERFDLSTLSTDRSSIACPGTSPPSPPPPPIPRRSHLRAQAQRKGIGAIRADINGQLVPIPVASTEVLGPKIGLSELNVNQSTGSQAADAQQHFVQPSGPVRAYYPFQEMLYRGRSIKYHIDPQGESSF